MEISSQVSSRKRKRADSSSEQIKVSAYDKSASAVGPVLAIFPALDPPKSTPFAVYAPPRIANTNANQSSAEQRDEEFARRSLRLAGETNAVEFFSTNESDEARSGCRYLIGIRNKRTNTLVLRPAPVQIFGRRVKALKNLTSLSPNTSTEQTERAEQRTALGEVFGTKKAQKAIRAAERNKVDVSAMQGVVGHIQDSVESGTRGLPTLEEAKQIADTTRQIPKFDPSAARPEDVYKLQDIIPNAELQALPIKDLLSASSQEERMSMIPGPFARSEWMKQHIQRVFNEVKPSKKTLRILLYIAVLITFRSGAPRYCSKRADLEARLPGIPSIVIDGVYSRFTETVRGSSEYVLLHLGYILFCPSPAHLCVNRARFTTDNAVRLLTHVFALCLHVDNFASDATMLASDLKEPVTKINQHFKPLGCKIEKLSTSEMSRLGLSATTAEHKRAVLRVPLEFPKTRTRRRT